MGTDRFRFFVMHLNGDKDTAYRTETLVVPNNTVIALVELLHHSGIAYEHCFAYDQGVQSSQDMYDILCPQIRECINEKNTAIVLFSVLVYNAEETISMTKRLREDFGNDIKTVLGGQLTTQLYDITKSRSIEHPYLQYADSVACGDGELLIPEIVQGLLTDTLHNIYNLRYDTSLMQTPFVTISTLAQSRLQGIDKRLEEMYKIAGFTQLSVQGKGGPGCRRAIMNGQACEFCALTSITTKNTTSLEDLLRQGFLLKQQFAVDRIFDVANQFIPHGVKERKTYLTEYLRLVSDLEQEYKIQKPDLFVYLTLSSLLDKETVSLLSQCGVRHAYVGFEHLDTAILHDQHKPVQRKALDATMRALTLCQQHGIKISGGFVLGTPEETHASIRLLEDGFSQLVKQFVPDTLVQFGMYPVEIIPGSAYFRTFMEDVYDQEFLFKNSLAKDRARGLFEQLLSQGYWSREEQKKMTEIFINQYSSVSYEDIVILAQALEDTMRVYGGIGYQVDDGDDPSQLGKYVS